MVFQPNMVIIGFDPSPIVITLWLFNIAVENHHAINRYLMGKPSISIRAIYTMAMLVITRG